MSNSRLLRMYLLLGRVFHVGPDVEVCDTAEQTIVLERNPGRVVALGFAFPPLVIWTVLLVVMETVLPYINSLASDGATRIAFTVLAFGVVAIISIAALLCGRDLIVLGIRDGIVKHRYQGKR